MSEKIYQAIKDRDVDAVKISMRTLDILKIQSIYFSIEFLIYTDRIDKHVDAKLIEIRDILKKEADEAWE